MALTVIIEDVIRKDGSIIIRALLTDGNSKFPIDEFSVTSQAELNARLLSEIDRHSKTDESILKISKGPYDPTPLPPTQDEANRNQYGFMLFRLLSFKRAVEFGAIASDNQQLIDAQKYVIDNFKTEYLELF